MLVITEPADDAACKGGNDPRGQNADDGSELRCKEKGLAGALSIARAVVVARDGLEALSDADHNVADQKVYLIGDRERRDGRVSVNRALNIHERRGETRHALPGNGRKAHGDDLPIVAHMAADVLRVQMHNASAAQK